MQTVTLKQVAAVAEVSVSTASRALNGQAEKFRISADTAEKVQQAAQKLGFQPSRLARSLRLQQTGLLGIVVPDISNPFFSAIAREITLAAEEQGLSVLLADSQESTEREATLVRELKTRLIEGLIVCPVGVCSQHLEEIQLAGLPLVLVDRTFPETSLVQITSEHQRGAAEIARLLINHGHRQIGLLQGLPGTLPNDWRLQGAQQSLHSSGIDWRQEWIAGDNFTYASGYQGTVELLQRYPEITALFAFSAPNAFGALKAAQESGRKIPEDLSIVCFDESPFAEFLAVPLTAAAQNVSQLGQTAAQILFQQMETGVVPDQKLHLIDIELKMRQSIRKVNTP